MYDTVGIETHMYAPELNRLHARDLDTGKITEFMVECITDIREAEKHCINKYELEIVGYE